jgi:hypothetical protein
VTRREWLLIAGAAVAGSGLGVAARQVEAQATDDRNARIASQIREYEERGFIAPAPTSIACLASGWPMK